MARKYDFRMSLLIHRVYAALRVSSSRSPGLYPLLPPASTWFPSLAPHTPPAAGIGPRPLRLCSGCCGLKATSFHCCWPRALKGKGAQPTLVGSLSPGCWPGGHEKQLKPAKCLCQACVPARAGHGCHAAVHDCYQREWKSFPAFSFL